MYLRPRTVDEAVAALAAGGRILAGGTDVFPALGDRPLGGRVIDVTGVAGLKGIDRVGGWIRIGAATTWRELIAADLPTGFDGLKAAAREVGARQIQALGTVAGNLCNASPAADGVPPLLALDAEVELASASGVRRLPLARFITGNRRTERRVDEIMTAILVPENSAGGRSCFLKLGARRYLVISIVMVAARIAAEDGRVAAARVAVGACSAVAQRLPDLERALVGERAAPGLGQRIEARHLAPLAPIDDVRATADYRRDAALALVRRAVEQCVGEAA